MRSLRLRTVPYLTLPHSTVTPSILTRANWLLRSTPRPDYFGTTSTTRIGARRTFWNDYVRALDNAIGGEDYETTGGMERV
jgi:hypothetical protein